MFEGMGTIAIYKLKPYAVHLGKSLRIEIRLETNLPDSY